MTNVFDDAADLLAELLDCGAEFMVVGAHALAAHGVVRATGDIDIWVRPTADNAQRVHQALSRFGAPLLAHGVTPNDFEAAEMVYQLGVAPRRIDVMTSIDGVVFEKAWPGRVMASFAGLTIPVLGRRHLIANKLATDRPKDRLDVEALRRDAGQTR